MQPKGYAHPDANQDHALLLAHLAVDEPTNFANSIVERSLRLQNQI